MKSNRIQKIIAALMAIGVIFCCFTPVSTTAEDAVGNITLQVKAPDSDEPLVNAAFRLYFVAALHETNGIKRFEYVAPYDQSGMELGSLQDAALPIHLTHFAKSHALDYILKQADEKGDLLFEDLAPGVYLLVPSEELLDRYSALPFLVSLPHYDAVNQVWQYTIDATPKMGEWSKEPETTYMSVSKKWSVGNHPKSITAVLQCDLEDYERVVLSDENGWQHRWDDLPKNHIWTVIEEQVPDGYTVDYKTSSNTVTIINYADVPDTPPTEPEPDEPPDELIQTGQLNWPVPVFATMGLLLFFIGWALLNLDKKETE